MLSTFQWLFNYIFSLLKTKLTLGDISFSILGVVVVTLALGLIVDLLVSILKKDDD
jgi:hypothetical protein